MYPQVITEKRILLFRRVEQGGGNSLSTAYFLLLSAFVLYLFVSYTKGKKKVKVKPGFSGKIFWDIPTQI